MSKHKKFHSLRGKGKAVKIYAFRHRANAIAAALQESEKKTAFSALEGSEQRAADLSKLGVRRIC